MLEKYINNPKYSDYKLYYTCDMPIHHLDVHDEDVEPLKCICNLKNKLDAKGKKKIVLGYNLNHIKNNNFIYDEYSTKSKTLSVDDLIRITNMFYNEDINNIEIYDGINIVSINNVIKDDNARALVCII